MNGQILMHEWGSCSTLNTVGDDVGLALAYQSAIIVISTMPAQAMPVKAMLARAMRGNAMPAKALPAKATLDRAMLAKAVP